MNETTTMLANTIKLILGDIPWVYSPQLSIEDKIEELRKKNLEKELTGYDEDGNETYKPEIKRFTEGKINVMENKFNTVNKIVGKYSDIEDEQ